MDYIHSLAAITLRGGQIGEVHRNACRNDVDFIVRFQARKQKKAMDTPLVLLLDISADGSYRAPWAIVAQ